MTCFSHDIAEEGRIGEDGTVELVVVKKRAIQIYKIGESMHIKRVTKRILSCIRYVLIYVSIFTRNYHLQMVLSH